MTRAVEMKKHDVVVGTSLPEVTCAVFLTPNDGSLASEGRWW